MLEQRACHGSVWKAEAEKSRALQTAFRPSRDGNVRVVDSPSSEEYAEENVQRRNNC